MLDELIQAPGNDEAGHQPVRQAKEKGSELVAHAKSLGFSGEICQFFWYRQSAMIVRINTKALGAALPLDHPAPPIDRAHL